LSLDVGGEVGRVGGRDDAAELGREVGRGVGRGVDGGTVGVTVLLVGSLGAAALFTWAPAREIADHTLTVAIATTMVQTRAQIIMGSPRLIRPSCRIPPGSRSEA
jgi:hypothetical protein